jgi:hypothetical protein
MRRLILMICLTSFPRVVSAQADTLRHIVFVHGGAGYQQYQWNSAIGIIGSSYGFPLGYADPDIPNSTAMWGWRNYVQTAMADTSILVGYSVGGLASRDAAQYEVEGGIITVGSPHTGAPIAASLGSATYLLAAVSLDMAQVFSVMGTEALEALGWLGESFYYEALALIDGGVVGFMAALGYAGFGMLDDVYPAAFQLDLPPASAFIEQLPTNVANSFTYSVGVSEGHLGGPLALDHQTWSQEDADEFGFWLIQAGGLISAAIAEAYGDIDWGHEHHWEIMNALDAGWRLGDDLMNYPAYWCAAVETGNVFLGCSFSSDLFIPTARQSFQGAQNTAIFPGPVHTLETEHVGIIDGITLRVCDLSPKCF